jgi:hypothetical protein
MKSCFFYLVLLSAVPAFAQKFHGALNFQMPIPQGDFATTLSTAVGFGPRFNCYYRPSPDLPFHVGLDVGWARINNERIDFSSVIGSFRRDFNLQATGSFTSLGLLLRVQPTGTPRINPFVEGLGGINLFRSRSILTDEEGREGQDNTDSFLNRGDNTFYYGLNAGLKIRFKAAHEAGLLLSCAYLVGGEAEYGDNPQIDNDLNVFWEYKTSRTSMLIPQLGLWFKL